MIFAIFLACSSTKEESALDAGVVPDDNDVKINVTVEDVKSPRKPKKPRSPKKANGAEEATETEKVTEATETTDATKAKTTESESSTPN